MKSAICPKLRSLYRRPISTISISDIHEEIKNLVSKKQYDEALTVYKDKLHILGINFTIPVLASIVKSCSFQRYNRVGYQFHCICLKSGSDQDSVISNSLISMYGKFFCFESARKVFDEMPHRDSITYCSLINCYTQKGSLVQALETIKEMYLSGFVPKPELIAAVVSLCVRTGSRKAGSMIHALLIVDQRIEPSVFVSTALIDMYVKFSGDLSLALRVFHQMGVKNEVAWTALISGCVADHNDYNMAVDLFREMLWDNMKPNRVTLLSVLPAFAELGCIKQGMEIHGFAIRRGFASDHLFSAALLKMYSKFKNYMDSARAVFEISEVKDVVTWSSMITGYAETGDSAEPIALFNQMRIEGTAPNSVTCLGLISASAHQASSTQARGIHGYVVKQGFDLDVSTGNALVHMYSKCGCLIDSGKIFDELAVKDNTVSWSSLISGYGLNGRGKEALKLFQEMQEKKVKIDSLTLLAILSACNHSGLVEEGQIIFNQASEHYKIPLVVEHYACYIDLLGKCGKIDEAHDVLKRMPMEPNARIWRSLVVACKVHRRLDIAEQLGNRLIRSEPGNPANYALLGTVRAQQGNWHGMGAAWRAMKERGLSKSHGVSRIEIQR